jgi:hypothetical protein
VLLFRVPVVGASDNTSVRDAPAQSSVERAQDEVSRVKAMVDQGILPKARLIDAEGHLADAEDEATLTATLFGAIRVQDMTPAQATSMVEAAQRRVDREQSIVNDRRGLVESGILARSDFQTFEAELASRQRVLELAKNRAKLLDDLKQMAETEKQLETAAARARWADLGGVMTRYDGSGFFSPKQLPSISSEFEQRFHHALPVSATGQTEVHTAMGLDHHNRVDISLNPDSVEGVWLRHLLERRSIPYLAFRFAVLGAATAPHIHLGLGSTPLALVQP